MKATRKQKRAAAKAPLWVRDIAAANFDPHGNRRHRDSKLGTFGAASEVRRIDPSTYLQSPLPSSSPAETIPAGTGQPVADLPAGHQSEDPCLSAQLAMGIAA